MISTLSPHPAAFQNPSVLQGQPVVFGSCAEYVGNVRVYSTVILNIRNYSILPNKTGYPSGTDGFLTQCTQLRVETKMHFSIFAKMRKSCENGTIFAKLRFAQIFVFAKISRKSHVISRKQKSIKFYSDTACILHVE
jgi:hypothetical protein